MFSKIILFLLIFSLILLPGVIYVDHVPFLLHFFSIFFVLWQSELVSLLSLFISFFFKPFHPSDWKNESCLTSTPLNVSLCSILTFDIKPSILPHRQPSGISRGEWDHYG
jgi:hypothetical protein